MLSRILQPLPSGSKLNSHQTPINSVSSRRRKWRAGSPNGKGFTIIGNSVIDCSGLKPNEFTLLAKIARFSHNVTGEVTVEVAVLAREMGWQDRWTRKVKARIVSKGFLEETTDYDPVLRMNKPNTYRILNPLKPVETTVQKDSTPPVLKDRQVLKETLLSQTLDTPPTPPVGGTGVCKYSPSEDHLEPQRPAPSAEVWESEQLGRRLRRERKGASRMDHYREVRERGARRRCIDPHVTPLARAASEVMRLCGVVETSWKIKAAIEAAISLVVEQNGRSPLTWVEVAVMNWREYQEDGLLLFRVGIERFFSEGLWLNQRLWTYDQERLREYRRRRVGY